MPDVLAYAPLISATAAMGALVVSIIAAVRADLAARRVGELHVLVNSRLSELVKTSTDLARSEGQAAGHAAGLAEGLDLTRVPIVTPPVIVVVPREEAKKET